MKPARLLSALLLLWTASAAATQVRFYPLQADGAATGTMASTVTVRLVNAAGQPIIGFRSTDWAPVTAYLLHEIPADGEPWVVDLTPQSAIATEGGTPTYYAVEIRAAHRREPYRIQVPDSSEVRDLADLVGAATIDPAEWPLSTRLIPPGGTAGQALGKAGATDYDVEWMDVAPPETDPVWGASPSYGITADLISHWSEAYGWGDHAGLYDPTGSGAAAVAGHEGAYTHDLIGSAVQPGDDVTVMGSGATTSGYAPLADGAGGVTWGPTISPVDKLAPSGMTVDYGTLDAGTVASLASKDGTAVAISEVSGANALQVTMAWSGVTTFSSIEVYGRYQGGAGHEMAVEVYDPDLTTWERYGTIASSTTDAWHFFTIADPTEHISGGAVQVRLRHVGTGVASHDLYLDYVALVSIVQGGVIAHEDLTGRSVADQHPASAITNTPAGRVAATSVQAAIDELDTEKLTTAEISTAMSWMYGWSNTPVVVSANAWNGYVVMPYGLTITAVECAVVTAPTSGYIQVGLKENGTTILSTPVTIDATEYTSLTAATRPVVSDTSLAYGSKLTMTIDAIGAVEPGKGLQCWIVGLMP